MSHLDKIRKMPCLVCGGQAEAHHLKAVGIGRNRKNDIPEHLTAIPLCRLHHAEIHSIGVSKFDAKYAINCWRIAFQIVMGI